MVGGWKRTACEERHATKYCGSPECTGIRSGGNGAWPVSGARDGPVIGPEPVLEVQLGSNAR
jgi:hypothetical protein